MVRAEGSASRIIGDRSATDPGGGMQTLGSHSSTKAGRRGRQMSDNEGDVAGDGIVRLPVSTPRGLSDEEDASCSCR